MDNVIQIAARMKRIIRIVQTLEPALRERILVKQLEPGEELLVPEFQKGIVLVHSGLLKHLNYGIGDVWKCRFFECEGDCFYHSDTPFGPFRRGDRRRIAVELTTLYIIGTSFEMLKNKHPVFNRHVEKALRHSDARWYKLCLGTEEDPINYLRTFNELFPGILKRASKEDLADCLFMDVEELKWWLVIKAQ